MTIMQRTLLALSLVLNPIASAQAQVDVIAMGSSTGGTFALSKIFSELEFFLTANSGTSVPPVVVVQHAVDTGWVTAQDGATVKLTIKTAEAGTALAANHVYFAPAGQHMLITKVGGTYCISLSTLEAPWAGGTNRNPQPPTGGWGQPGQNSTSGWRASVHELFKSVADAAQNKSVGIQLTGRGVDGAEGLLRIRVRGGTTYAQNNNYPVQDFTDEMPLAAAGLFSSTLNSVSFTMGDPRRAWAIDILDEAPYTGHTATTPTQLTVGHIAARIYRPTATPGDANLSGVFNSADLVLVNQRGKYQNGANATWSDGDWNGDGRFDSSDYTLAYQQGNYQP